MADVHWYFNVPFMNSLRTSRDTTAVDFGKLYKHPQMTSFNVGWNAGIIHDEEVDIDMGQSYELELRNLICFDTRLTNRSWASIGLGLDWRNYRMTGDKLFSTPQFGSTVITVGPYPSGTAPKFSRIHTFSLCFPVQLHYAASNHCYVSLGADMYFNFYASTKTRYTYNGEKMLEKSGGLSDCTTGVTAGLYGEVTYYGVGVYYKFSPFRVLKNEVGPKFSSMTVGMKFSL